MTSTVLAASRQLPRLAPGATMHALARRGAIIAVLATVLFTAAYVWSNRPYSADDDLGYNLGLVGGVLMLLLLPYSLRKRARSLRGAGTMRAWFLFHIAAGILGPVLVLFHSTFRIGSFNGGVALGSTLLVAASGAVGRFFYRRVHRGLSGSRATLQEMQAEFDRHTRSLGPLLGHHPAVQHEFARFSELATREPRGRGERIVHFLALGWQRAHAGRRVRAALGGRFDAHSDMHASELAGLLRTADAALIAAQRTAQFATYERLFSLWHVVHIPFLYLLILTSVVHVVAVHAY
ncbi:hypothetical protein AZOA_29580 [Azoarcus sp. Aa7]|nr:hypothetical protein [Azoarcus sp. Aa7]